jgi:glutamate carboxypeptidase
MSGEHPVMNYLRTQQDDMIELVKDLVAMETPSTDPASQAAILARLRDEFEQLDYRVIQLPGRSSGGHLYAAPRQRGKHQPAQLMIGHCDTVWPLGTLETMPLQIEDGTLRGPGVYDMKAGLAEIVYALKSIRELGLETEVAPLCFVNSDEEIGSRESTRYLRALAQRVERCMVLEPSLGRSGKIKTARKGVGRFTVTVQGKAAHAGLDPGAGASAILELSHVIQKLFELNDPEHGTSVNVGVIDGGVRPNVIAPESRAVIDVRVQTRADAERIEAAIHGLKAETPGVTLRIEGAIHGLKAETPGVTLRIEGAIGRPPMEATEANQQFWRIAQTLGDELGLELEQATAGGGSDGNTTSLYSATLDGLGAVGDGAHASHEFIEIDRLCERCALLTLLLLTPSLESLPERRN